MEAELYAAQHFACMLNLLLSNFLLVFPSVGLPKMSAQELLAQGLSGQKGLSELCRPPMLTHRASVISP